MLKNKISHLLLSPDSESGGGSSVGTAPPKAEIAGDGGIVADKVSVISGKDFMEGKIPGAPTASSVDEGDDTMLDDEGFEDRSTPAKVEADKNPTPKELAAKKAAALEKEGQEDDLYSEDVADAAKAALKKEEAPVKKEEPTKSAVGKDGKSVQSNMIVPMKDAGTRDLTGIPEGDQPAFKGMPNPVFNYIAPRFKALLKREGEARQQLDQLIKDSGVPASYHEHPQGFFITPQYQEMLAESNSLTSEIVSFEDAIAAIDRGDGVVKKLIGYSKQTGQPQFTDVAVNEQNRQQVRNELVEQKARANVMMQNLEEKAKGYAQNHVARQKQVVESIRKAEASYFPFYEEGQPTWDDKAKKAHSDFLNKLPAEVRSHNPLASPLAKSYMVIQVMNGMLKAKDKLLAGMNKTPIDPKERQLAGPTGDDLTTHGGDGSGGEEMLDDKGWENEKRYM